MCAFPEQVLRRPRCRSIQHYALQQWIIVYLGCRPIVHNRQWDTALNRPRYRIVYTVFIETAYVKHTYRRNYSFATFEILYQNATDAVTHWTNSRLQSVQSTSHFSTGKSWSCCTQQCFIIDKQATWSRIKYKWQKLNRRLLQLFMLSIEDYQTPPWPQMNRTYKYELNAIV